MRSLLKKLSTVEFGVKLSQNWADEANDLKNGDGSFMVEVFDIDIIYDFELDYSDDRAPFTKKPRISFVFTVLNFDLDLTFTWKA